MSTWTPPTPPGAARHTANLTEARITYNRLIGRPLASKADGDALQAAADAMGIQLSWQSAPLYGGGWEPGRWVPDRKGNRRTPPPAQEGSK